MIISGTTLYGGTYGQPGAVVSDLTLWLDPNNSASYPGSGSTWYDISGNAANITLANSPAYTSGTPSYFTFNGTTQFGTGSTANVLPSSTYTKSMWFQWNNYGFNNNIVSSDPGGHFTFGSGQNRIYSGHSDWGNYNAFGTVATFNLNTWYYVAVTFDTAVGMKMYVNGVFDSLSTYSLSPRPGNGSVDVASFSTSNLLSGIIGEAFCYSRALSDSEVAQNFLATRTKYGV